MSKIKQNKTKIILLAICSLLLVGTLFVPAVQAASTGFFEYEMLEGIPGFSGRGDVAPDLPTFLSSIYKFGIWTVGIAAMFMIIIGGFTYMTSAGNKSSVGSAKGIINDALLGLVVALTAYLFLYVINPDLVKNSINMFSVKVEEIETLGYGEGGGSCAILEEGPCSVASLRNTCFGANAEAASKVCNYESGGRTNSASKTDKGLDGNVFSFGLFQINLTQHSLEGINCPGAFMGKNYNSKVIDWTTYQKCTIAASNAMTNIEYACKISNNGKNWNPWRNTKKACGL